ncbi:cytochrome C and Quinol oxidase polypeptide I family protein [Mycobacterium kansasii]|uniref:Cytochrome C and Quinol oxidase polypeptide I family protein n=1 Tax=Mycobacterium kansasii TaxID=1768 RepID=A0A1V3X6N4_MYCKA|nr:cytochrome C and Quinol oxidase polypeptide I family protein [Mycobacterium kansasii]
MYFWFPKMTGRLLDERLGKLHFWLTLIGFHTTFLVQHWLGNMGMPRRYADYLATDGFQPLNIVSTIGALILGVSMLPFVWNVFKSWRYGEPVSVDDPWGYGNSLEWATTCPPPRHNFTELPASDLNVPLSNCTTRTWCRACVRSCTSATTPGKGNRQSCIHRERPKMFPAAPTRAGDQPNGAWAPRRRCARRPEPAKVVPADRGPGWEGRSAPAPGTDTSYHASRSSNVERAEHNSLGNEAAKCPARLRIRESSSASTDLLFQTRRRGGPSVRRRCATWQ